MLTFLWCLFPSLGSAFAFYYMMCLGEGVLHIQLLISHYIKPWQEVTLPTRDCCSQDYPSLQIDAVLRTEQWYRWQILSNVNITPMLSTRHWRRRLRLHPVLARALDLWLAGSNRLVSGDR